MESKSKLILKKSKISKLNHHTMFSIKGGTGVIVASGDNNDDDDGDKSRLGDPFCPPKTDTKPPTQQDNVMG